MPLLGSTACRLCVPTPRPLLEIPCQPRCSDVSLAMPRVHCGRAAWQRMGRATRGVAVMVVRRGSSRRLRVGAVWCSVSGRGWLCRCIDGKASLRCLSPLWHVFSPFGMCAAGVTCGCVGFMHNICVWIWICVRCTCAVLFLCVLRAYVRRCTSVRPSILQRHDIYMTRPNTTGIVPY